MVALPNNTKWYVKDNAPTGTIGWSAITPWSSGATTAAGVVRRQLATPAVGSERAFVCIAAGTTGGSEPTWVVTKGAKTTDNTVTWQECTGQAGVNGNTTDTPAWGATLTTTLGQIIYDSITGALQIVTTAGTTKSGSPPSFSATAGTTTTDNTTTWTSLGLASNFTAWATPHARLSNALAATWGAAGDAFYVSNNHAATQSSALTLVFPGTTASPNAVYCVNDSVAVPTTLAATATESTTGASALSLDRGFAYVYGIGFSAGSGSNAASMLLASSSGAACALYLDSCAFNVNNTSASSIFGLNSAGTSGPKFLQMNNCTIAFGATTQSITFGTCRFTMTGGSIAATGSVPATLINNVTSDGSVLTIADCDLSALTGNLLIFSKPVEYACVLENCKLNASLTPATGSAVSIAGGSLEMWNCDSASTNYNYRIQNYLGTMTPDVSVCRVGGASNGTTPISARMVTTANSKYLQPFASKEIVQWQSSTGSPRTATIQIDTDSTLNNNDCWVQIEYPGAASSPLGSIATSRMTPLATPAALTASSATWTNARANAYQIAATFTPQMAGPIKATVFLALAGTTVYVDPLITIT